MSKHSTIHNKPYRNWVRGALGLLYVHDGLYPFTDRVVKAEHSRILETLAPCTSCTIINIQPEHAGGKVCIQNRKTKCNCKHKMSKACNTCRTLYDEIILQHRFRDPNWETDASTWCNDHWQFAKCFIATSNQGSNTAADTDAAGLLSIFINGLFFQSELQCNIDPPYDALCQLKEVRNTIFHNSTLELADGEVTNYLHAMIVVLKDQKSLINDSSAQAAVKRLKKLIKDELVITTNEETNAIQTVLDSIKKAKEQSEDSIKKLTAEKQKSLQDHTAKAEQKIKAAKDQATAEVESTVAKVFEERFEPEIKRLKLEYGDHEQRLKAVEQEQSDLTENLQKLEKQVSVLNTTEEKHKKRIDYLKQKHGLQRYLVELYQNHHLQTWASPLITQDNNVNISEVFVAPEMIAEEKDGKDIPINCYQDLFLSHDNRNKKIYIIGDVGTGKSSFCKMMMQYWCKVVKRKWDIKESDYTGNQNVELENDDDTKNIGAFEFLLYVPLHKMSGFSDDFSEMIMADLKKYEALLDEIFLQESECCLILADGLDESTPPRKCAPCLSRVANRLPTSGLAYNATVIITSTPSASGLLHMKSSQYDLKVKLLGIKDMQQMVERYMALLLKSQLSVSDFNEKLLALGLEGLQYAPMLLQQLIWIYCKGYEISTSVTHIYTNIVNIVLAWIHGKSWTKPSLSDFRNTAIGRLPLPEPFEKFSRCQENSDLIILLGKVAYEIFVSKGKSSVVLDRYKLKQFGLSDKDISAIVQIGVLNEVRSVDPTYAKSQISFIHTSYVEFFAAVYFSSCRLSQAGTGPVESSIIADLNLRKSSTTEILRISNFLIMVCGLTPFLTEEICDSIYQVVSTDENLLKYRRYIRTTAEYVFNEKVVKIQDTCLRCVSESKSNIQQLKSLIKVVDLTNDWPWNGNMQLEKCLSCVDSASVVTCNLSYYDLSHELCKALLSFISQSVSLRTLTLRRVKCKQPKCDGYSINLSHLKQLQCLRLYNSYQNHIHASAVDPLTNLESCQIWRCTLSQELSTTLYMFLPQAVSLKTLELSAIECMEDKCKGHINDQLKCDQIFVNTDNKTLNLESCTIEKCNISHDLYNSLSSLLTRAMLLKSLKLEEIKCMKDKCGGHKIDLSHHAQLQRLVVRRCDHLSVSVNRKTELRSCKIEKYNVSHDKYISLSSFLSQEMSLQSLELNEVKCTDIEDECGKHSIDLSHHEQLQRLAVSGCDYLPVFGVNLKTKLVSCKLNKCNVSHDKYKSLSLFISRAVSLKSLELNEIKCKTDVCDGHSIDLSHHEQLQSLAVGSCDHLSVFGVNRSTKLLSCKIEKCNVSHEQYISISSFLSQAVSLKSLELNGIQCLNDECGGHNIDFCHHEQLQSLAIGSCDHLLVFCKNHTTKLESCCIEYCNVSHEQNISLLSFLSRAASLKSLELNEIKCTNMKDEYGGYNIDLSHHEQLQSLAVGNCDHLLVFGGSLKTKLRSCKIEKCNVSHEQCISLSSFLSQSVSLSSLELIKIKCMKDECGGHNIDLSHHAQLQSLALSSCNHLSVCVVNRTTELVSCKIEKCNVSHEQYISLSSLLSRAASLKSLELIEVKCTNIEDECGEHSIDLSHHEQLQSLVVCSCDYLPVFGENHTTKLESCKIEKCNVSHEQYTSLSSFLSRAASLKSLELIEVKCTDIEDECGEHSIDLSHHEQLQSLVVCSCDYLPVFGENHTTKLESCKIEKCNVSHEQYISLSLFLSRAASLKSLELNEIKCMKDECDGHNIDLSHHEQLQDLVLCSCDQLPVFGENLATNLKLCRIINCNLSHDKITSLHALLSRAVSLECLILRGIKYRYLEYKCDVHFIDLSHHEKLKMLMLTDCDDIPLFGDDSSTNFWTCWISNCNFSHKLCSFLSMFLSGAVSLEIIKLTNVNCTQTGCMGHSIDLTRHEKLQCINIVNCGNITGAIRTTDEPTCSNGVRS